MDADGKVHGLDNLYVVDGSVLPRLQPSQPLTIYAWALRVANGCNKGAVGMNGALPSFIRYCSTYRKEE
ncbi:MAG: GMC oxidoreductase [Candidatus Competibacteraceae bacterium]